jgi:hypothetical protein
MGKSCTCFFDEDLSGFCKFDQPAFFAVKQMKSILLFEFCDLLAKRRLGDVQPVGGTGEVHFLGQNDYCMEVTHFDIGEHNSNPLELQRRFTLSATFALHQ